MFNFFFRLFKIKQIEKSYIFNLQNELTIERNNFKKEKKKFLKENKYNIIAYRMQYFENMLKKVKDLEYNKNARIKVDSSQKIVFDKQYDDGILLVPFLLKMFKKCGYDAYYEYDYCHEDNVIVIQKKK